MAQDDQFKKLVSHCKEYGFIFQSSEVYDGLSAVYDYGPYGVELKNNIKKYWWDSMVQMHENIVGIDAAIFMHPKTFTKAKKRFGEAFDEAEFRKTNGRVLANLEKFEAVRLRLAKAMTDEDMVDLKAMLEEEGKLYLRPETAQGIFVNFLNVQKTTRQKIPFGIAQIGKAFRNEIVARQFIFRMREFEQMEMQFFIKPGTQKEWYAYWKEHRLKWHKALGTPAEKFRFHDHDNLAFYADAAVDIEFEFPFGFKDNILIQKRTKIMYPM